MEAPRRFDSMLSTIYVGNTCLSIPPRPKRDLLKPKLASETGLTRFHDDEEELFAGLLYLSGRLAQQLDEVCREWGITDDQYNVLRILQGSRPAGLPRFEIAEKLFNRAPDVTRLLDRLEAKSLVVRTRSGPDRRQSISTITPQGLGLLDSMSEDIRAVHLEVIHALSPEEREAFRTLLRRIIRKKVSVDES
jgi:DNA-binding MarR family transcriptional regulator